MKKKFQQYNNKYLLEHEIYQKYGTYSVYYNSNKEIIYYNHPKLYET